MTSVVAHAVGPINLGRLIPGGVLLSNRNFCGLKES